MAQKITLDKRKRLERRRYRVRSRIRRDAKDSLRLSMFISSRHIHVQLIDDSLSNTLASISTISESDIRSSNTSKNNTNFAKELGKRFANKIRKIINSRKIILDRGEKKYHGVIKSFYDSFNVSLNNKEGILSNV